MGAKPIPLPPAAFGASKTPRTTVEMCAFSGRKVASLKWEKETAWCSETVSLRGVTANYADGETIAVAVTERTPAKAQAASLSGAVAGNAFQTSWTVVDVLPSRQGTGGYSPRKQLDAKADNARTPKPLDIRFVLNFSRYSAKGHKVTYNRTEPAGVDAKGNAIPEKKLTPQIESNYDMTLANGLVTLVGDLHYVRGWGKMYLDLGDDSLPGSFKMNPIGATNHWGRQDPVTTAWEYWDGSKWTATPATWIANQSNQFAADFYKLGPAWVCRTNPLVRYPEELPDWPESVYKGAGNMADAKLAVWKSAIESAWSGKFDLKRIGCQSAAPACCRYKTRAQVKFETTNWLGGHDLILGYEPFRSDSRTWSLADSRDDFLAPHEFGHLLGAPDEYAGVFSTQLGQNDGDGLVNGVDPSSLMNSGKIVKKRHFKGICEVMGAAVNREFGKDYRYEAVDPAPAAALPPETPVVKDKALGDAKKNAAILGGLAGAAAGALAGGLASGWNPAIAIGGGLAGAVAGAVIGGMIVK